MKLELGTSFLGQIISMSPRNNYGLILCSVQQWNDAEAPSGEEMVAILKSESLAAGAPALIVCQSDARYAVNAKSLSPDNVS